MSWIIIEAPNADPDLELSVENHKGFSKTKPEFDELPANSRVAFDLGYRMVSLVLEGVLFDSRGDAEDCLLYLNRWNDIEPYVVKIQISSTPSYFKQDGSNTELKYLYIDISEIEKLTKGNEQVYRIGRILFKQG